MPNPAMILCTGPEPYLDRITGEEHPEWYVFPADADREPTGKVYTCRKSFEQAARLATRIAVDRHLALEMDACPA